MTQFIKNNYLALILLVLAILIRVIFSFNFAHPDLITQSTWGKQVYELGTLKGYYNWNSWNNSPPNHPPLISWLYFAIYPLHHGIMWFLSNLGNFIALHRLAPTKFYWLYNFSIWFGTKLYGTTSLLAGIIFLLKQFMILADLSIGLTIFFLCRKAKTDWKVPVLTYLLLPFSWYLSASWGQSDQLSFIFLLISFLLINSKKYSKLSPILYAISANLKPNSILLLPVFLYTWYKQKQSLFSLVIGGITAIIFSFWTVSWYTSSNVFTYVLTLPKIITTSGGLTNYNAFNFWYIFHPFSVQFATPDTNTYFFLSAKTWGWILTLATTILSFKVIKNKRPESIFSAMFIAGFGSWMFMTGMHERYSFLAVAPIIILSVYQRKYLQFFLALSTIYTLNMFIAYWPWPNLSWVNDIFKFNYYLIPRFLSFTNLLVYFQLTYKLVKDSLI